MLKDYIVCVCVCGGEGGVPSSLGFGTNLLLQSFLLHRLTQIIVDYGPIIIWRIFRIIKKSLMNIVK